jgi:hypothetical protein
VQGPLAQQHPYQHVPPYQEAASQEELHEANDIEAYLLNQTQPYYDFTAPVDFSPRNYQKEWKISKERVQDDGASSRSGHSYKSGLSGGAPKLHFGPAPTGKQARRNAVNVKKKVALTHGNLVLDCPFGAVGASGHSSF